MAQTLLPSTSIDGKGYSQRPEDAISVKDKKEASVYFNLQNVNASGSTVTFEVYHAARNRDADYKLLFSVEFPAGTGGTTFSYQNQFAEFIRTKVIFADSSNTNNQADAETLWCGKS